MFSAAGKHIRTWSLEELFSDEELTCIRLMTGIAKSWNFWSASSDALFYSDASDVLSIRDLLGRTIEVHFASNSVKVFRAERAPTMKKTKCTRLK
jgi:hypothetical protein